MKKACLSVEEESELLKAVNYALTEYPKQRKRPKVVFW